MKTIKIYKRTITEKTGYSKFPYKQVEQITILYNNIKTSNHYENIDNPRLKVKFELILNTRKKSDLKGFIDRLGRSDNDKWQKQILSKILGK